MRVPILFLSLILVASAYGRIGDTPIQFVDRYGAPKDTPSTRNSDKNWPLIEGAIHHTYEYHGWKIRAAFLQLGGPAVRIEFSKLWNGQDTQIQDYELQAIATANTPAGMSWKRIMYDNPNSPNKAPAKLVEGFLADATGQKMWRRSDGAILWLRSNQTVRVELPAARQHEEQLKIAKDQKARASVPQF